MLAAAAVVIGVVLADGGGAPGSGGATGTSATSADATPDGGSPASDPPAGPALAVGDCLAAGGAATACDGAHESEVYSTSGCSQDQLLAYLGGRAGSDVLRSDLTLAEVSTDAGAACTVGRPGESLDGSNDGVLGGDDGDVWRRCQNANSDEVPCSQVHTAEVIFVQADSTESLNCVARASQYLGMPFDQHSDDLEVGEAGRAA